MSHRTTRDRHPHRPTARHEHRAARHRVPLSVLAALIAGDTLELTNPVAAFAIDADRTAVLVDHHGTVTTLRPGRDGLYDVPHDHTTSA